MKRLTILLFASVISLVGCARQPQVPVVIVNKVAPQSTTAWVLMDWKTPAGRQAVIPEQGKRPITLQFQAIDTAKRATEGTVSGYTGCNNIEGFYTETSDTLNIGKLTATKQVCDPLTMRMERAFIQHISNVSLQKSLSRSDKGNLLILTSREGEKWTFVEEGAVRSLPSYINR
jgi:heat shock protein HslJ